MYIIAKRKTIHRLGYPAHQSNPLFVISKSHPEDYSNRTPTNTRLISHPPHLFLSKERSLKRLLLLQHTTRSLPASDPLQPSTQVRKLLLFIIYSRRHCLDARLPGDKSQVRISTLVTNEILSIFQMTIEDARDTLHLFYVAFNSGREFLGVEVCKPATDDLLIPGIFEERSGEGWNGRTY